MSDDEPSDYQPALGVGNISQLTEKPPEQVGQFVPVVRPIGFMRLGTPKRGVRVVKKWRKRADRKAT